MRCALAALSVLALASGVRADGGIPQTLQVRFAADKPDSIYAMTNYGPIVSHDAGCTFFWLCETNVGYGGAYIPDLAVTRDGTILATSFVGLRVSHDGGCTFTSVINDGFVAGVAIDDNTIWASTADSSRENDVYTSTDNGVTFTPRGLASTTHRWSSVRASQGRVYVAGIDTNQVAQVRRLDGEQWTPLPTTGIVFGTPPTLRIAAIDPERTSTVYLVSEHSYNHSLYRSIDGGMTWTLVHESAGKIKDVVVRGESVIVTAMVREGMILVGATPMISTDGGLTFAPYAGAPTLACAELSPSGALHGCGANWEPDFAAIARDDGNAWTKLFRFTELAGPLACPADSGQTKICEPLWTPLDVELMTTGPVCGTLATDGGTTIKPPTPPESCCGVGARPTSLLWAFVVVFLLSACPYRRLR
jgi:hypothetical protein